MVHKYSLNKEDLNRFLFIQENTQMKLDWRCDRQSFFSNRSSHEMLLEKLIPRLASSEPLSGDIILFFLRQFVGFCKGCFLAVVIFI